MIRTVLTLLLAATAAHASAQTVWRCGADGRSYSDAPCPGGQAVAVADARSSADVADARAVVQRDRQLAREMAQERHERERELALRGSGLAGIGTTPRLTPTAAQRPLAKRRPTPAGAGTSRAAARGTLQRLD